MLIINPSRLNLIEPGLHLMISVFLGNILGFLAIQSHFQLWGNNKIHHHYRV